uniref:NADH-ubiquinone oxidoreductase chain 4L n=1 Tax=Monomachus antipodalis TaxID=161211 RepID=A0A0E3G7N0_9HYME|nr:NADH dehydrogenase subunit 4L [Monomachus antipodalis]
MYLIYMIYFYYSMCMMLFSCLLMILIYKYLLMILMTMEMMMISILFMISIFFNTEIFNLFMILYFLSFSVCEAVLGLSLMILFIRMKGNDYMNCLNLNLW